MKALKIIAACFALIVIGGTLIGSVGAGTPAGNTVTIATVIAIIYTVKRLSRA